MFLCHFPSHILIALVMAVGFSLHAEENKINNVTPQEAQRLIKEKNLTVIDVRTDVEFAEGHLDKAINHDFTDDGFKASLEKLDRQKPYLIHCEAGGRSTKSLMIFKDLGFKNIYHLDGGIRAWKEKGLPVTR